MLQRLSIQNFVRIKKLKEMQGEWQEQRLRALQAQKVIDVGQSALYISPTLQLIRDQILNYANVSANQRHVFRWVIKWESPVKPFSAFLVSITYSNILILFPIPNRSDQLVKRTFVVNSRTRWIFFWTKYFHLIWCYVQGDKYTT